MLYLLVPLHRPLSVFYFTAFRRRLRVEFDQNKQVVSSHIVEFITEDKVLREKGDLVLAEPQLFDRQLPGILVTYDFHYRLTYQLQGDSIAKESIYLHNPKQLLAIKQHPEQGFITLDYPSDQAPPSVTITCNDGSMWTNTSDGHWVSNHGEIVSMADVGGNPCQSGGGGASGGGAGGGSGIGSPPVGGGGSGSGSGSGNPGWQDGIELPPMDPGDTHPKFLPIKNPDNPLPGNPIDFGPFTPTEAFLSKLGLKVLWQQMMDIPEFQELVASINNPNPSMFMLVLDVTNLVNRDSIVYGYVKYTIDNNSSPNKGIFRLVLTPDAFSLSPGGLAMVITHELIHVKFKTDMVAAANTVTNWEALPQEHYLKQAYDRFNLSQVSQEASNEGFTLDGDDNNHITHCIMAESYRPIIGKVGYAIDAAYNRIKEGITQEDYIFAAWIGLKGTILYFREIYNSPDKEKLQKRLNYLQDNIHYTEPPFNVIYQNKNRIAL
ncbi:MAG: hypothetical protein KatS3mg033_1288 [Thermonema sp.]|uniref:hypothetical protein n=1 Tax=Thermonema sp. TaxID=2231181 RepID=UPI0021DCBA30|nr:hypothetical protein [Thermonema sp.]GIV39488.1 MAG: hypothetical protein KatS3mg033_1288 [Thermonema sp.]